MAMRTYEYRFMGPTVDQVGHLCMGQASMTMFPPDVVMLKNVQFDDALTDPDDLNEAMRQYGWAFQQDVTP